MNKRQKEIMKYTDREYIDHYTCNPPSEKVLRKNKITFVGDEYGREKNEYVRIPVKLLKKRGLFSKDERVLCINCEILMRDLK